MLISVFVLADYALGFLGRMGIDNQLGNRLVRSYRGVWGIEARCTCTYESRDGLDPFVLEEHSLEAVCHRLGPFDTLSAFNFKFDGEEIAGCLRHHLDVELSE